MAPYNQQTHPHGPPGYGSLGRGGGNNGGRGNGKKGRGNNNCNGNGNNGGNNNNNNNWRTPSYGNSGYGPRDVPDGRIQEAHQGWGAQYGGGSYPVPMGAMGSYTHPTYIQPAAAMGFDPRTASAGQGPLVSMQIPSHASSHATFSAQNTPISIPSLPVAMLAPMPSSPTSSGKKTISPSTNADITGGAVGLSQASTVEISRSQGASTRVRRSSSVGASSRASVHTPAQKQPTKPPTSRSNAKVSPFPLGADGDGYLPREGQTLPIDKLHQTIQNAFEGVDQQVLLQLEDVEEGFTASLQKTLVDACTAHESQEASQQKQRETILDHIHTARASEVRHEKNVIWSQNAFAQKMKEACKLGGDEKDAAQRKAIDWIQAATAESLIAAERRAVIEECRRDLLVLDNVRVIAATTYAVAIQDVVAKALGSVKGKSDNISAVEEDLNTHARSADVANTIADSGEAVKLTTDLPHNLAPMEGKKTSDEEKLFTPVQQANQPSVLERDEERIALRQPEDNSATHKEQLKPQEKPESKAVKTQEPQKTKQPRKKGKNGGQQPTLKPTEAVVKTEEPAQKSRAPTPKPQETVDHGATKILEQHHGAKQSKKKGKTANQELKSTPQHTASKVQDPGLKPQEPTHKPDEPRETSKASPVARTEKSSLMFDDDTSKPQEESKDEPAKYSQSLEPSIMNIPTEHGTVKKLAITVNGHTIMNPGDIAALLEGEQARKNNAAVKDDSMEDEAKEKFEIKDKGKTPLKGEKNKASKTVPDPLAVRLAAALAQANSPAVVQLAKRKKKSKKKKDSSGDGKTGGDGPANGPGTAGPQPPATEDVRKGG
ncbi:hypothetical protein CC86DRAFT_451876 [Ophiobolus disseminans]|uniref:Uncharacterized protein n=1 Tax=Ophiobolus disseminans TaxID=1469910 RepID=A0A6A7AGG4_9PLEO|nr:hypothetical protein CC86DRAFT_451876 [Ophiobolus disseminans]